MNGEDALVFAWIIFILSELPCVLAAFYIFKYDWKPIFGTNVGHHSIWNPPLLCIAFSTIFITAHAIVLFRLIPGYRTRLIKYIHAAIHTANLFVAVYGSLQLNKYRTEHANFNSLISPISVGLPVLLIGGYFIQWLAAVFVYLYLYSNQARRRNFAAWHNFVGICLFNLSIAMFCSFFYNLDFFNAEYIGGALALTFLVIYGLLIDLIVLNPYLEWPLVGPI